MSWYVGIDPGSRHTGLAAVHDDGALRTQTIHPTGELPDRLVFLRKSVRLWLADIAQDGAWCCVVEQPGTRFGGASLLAAYGICVEAAASSLKCPVMTLPSAQWKKLALGNGAAKKSDVMAAAREFGYDGADQDQADAIGMARCAVILAQQVERAA